MKARVTVLLMVIAALFVIAPGCGGDDDSQSAATSAPNGAGNGSSSESGTKEGSGGEETGSEGGEPVESSSPSQQQFVKRASAECRRSRTGVLEEINAFISKDPKKNESVKAIYEEILMPKIEAELKIIRSLGAPEGDEEEIEAIVAAQEEAAEEAGQLPDPESFEELEPYFEEATQLMREYGFTACTGF